MLLLLVVVLSSYLPLRGLSSKSWAEYGTREGGGAVFLLCFFISFFRRKKKKKKGGNNSLRWKSERGVGGWGATR